MFPLKNLARKGLMNHEWINRPLPQSDLVAREDVFCLLKQSWSNQNRYVVFHP